MNKPTKNDIKTGAMIATGTLAPFALLQSMTQSKTLIVMVIALMSLFGGLALFLSKIAGG